MAWLDLIEDIKEIINNDAEHLVEHIYSEGFEAGVKTRECSWEKGVKDAWEYISHTAHSFVSKAHTDAQAVNDILDLLDDLDPVSYTRWYVETRNSKDEAETFAVGDIVTDFSGEECYVTHTEEEDSVAVMYADGRVENWKPETLEKTGRRAIVRVSEVIGDGELL